MSLLEPPKTKMAAPVPELLEIVELAIWNGVLPIKRTCSVALLRNVQLKMFKDAAAFEKMTPAADGPVLSKNSRRLRVSVPMLLNSRAAEFAVAFLPPLVKLRSLITTVLEVLSRIFKSWNV